MRRLDPDWLPALVIGGALFIGAGQLFGEQGIGLTWDSNYYLLFSQRMRLNLDFSTDGTYAPLYSMILAGLTALGASTGVAVVLVHAGSIMAIFLSATRLVRAAQAPPLMALAAGLYVTLVALGSVIFQFVWTEIPYCALLTVSTAITVSIWRGGLRPSVWWLLPIGLLAPMRFIGLVPSIYLSALILWRMIPRAKVDLRALLRLAAGTFLAFGPIALFACLNHRAWGCALGCREPSTTGVGENLVATGVTFASELPQFTGVVLIFVTAGWFVFTGPISRSNFRSAAWIIPLSIVALSILAQVYASSRVEIDPIGPRYYAPLYPLFLVGLISLSWRIGLHEPRRLATGAFTAALLLAATMAAYRDVGIYGDLADDASDDAASLSDFGFKQSPLRLAFQAAQAEMLTEDQPGSLAAYAAQTQGVTDLAAYLVLDSAYDPPGARCRAGSIQSTEDGQTRIGLDCATKHGIRHLRTDVISDLSQLPADAELVIMDKSYGDDSLVPILIHHQGFQIIIETPAYRLLRRSI